MNTAKLKDAREEARRFLKRTDELLKAQADRPQCAYFYEFPKQAGAVRRASMDLTRALAELRRS